MVRPASDLSALATSMLTFGRRMLGVLMLTIGELARTTGANVSTIRHYELLGLMTHSARSDGNQRRYSDSDRDRLTFIKEARDLGMSIDSVRDMLGLNDRPEMSNSEADRIIAEQLGTVRQKIARLKNLEDELTRISAREPDQRVAGYCLLDVFSTETRTASER